MKLQDLRIKIFADGADLETMIRLNDDPLIKGLTTNPTLMRKAGVTNYEGFAKEVLKHVREKPVSFEVFSDDFPEMERQALKISGWGNNVYVKIPITNNRGESSRPTIESLCRAGVKVNITAVMDCTWLYALRGVSTGAGCIVSVFNGRIMDTGRPAHHAIAYYRYGAQALWASTREPWNIWQAESMGYDIITVPEPILTKAREMQGKDLTQLSLETVQMFSRDGAGYTL